jgi:hypothetical protein
VSARRARTLLYHFTHVDNVPSLLETGALLSDTAVTAGGLLRVEAGHRDIKARRRTLHVDAGPGGRPCDYVPFYFGTRSPMMFSISRGNVPTYADGEDPLVYVVTSVETVVEHGLPYAFSDGNCASGITDYFDDLARLREHVDMPLMTSTWWNNTNDDPDRTRRRMAEFLVHDRLPLDAVLGYGVRTPARRDQVRAILDAAGRAAVVAVRPAWYYG